MVTKLAKMALLATLTVGATWSGLPVGSAVDDKDHKDHKTSDDAKHAHPGDAIKAEEHQALFDLVDDCNATHTAVASGRRGTNHRDTARQSRRNSEEN